MKCYNPMKHLENWQIKREQIGKQEENLKKNRNQWRVNLKLRRIEIFGHIGNLHFY